jgi:hypothetical protein
MITFQMRGVEQFRGTPVCIPVHLGGRKENEGGKSRVSVAHTSVLYGKIALVTFLKQESSTQNNSFSYPNFLFYNFYSRSQWPRGLRHEPSSPARTLGPWVRIPLEAWMSVCVYSAFALFSV